MIRSHMAAASHRINRETVGRYLRLSKPAISITGTGAGRRSRCEALGEVIAAKVEVECPGKAGQAPKTAQNGSQSISLYKADLVIEAIHL